MHNAKSTVKRLLSVLLCVVMIMALAPMSVFAEEPSEPTPAPKLTCTVITKCYDENGNYLTEYSETYSEPADIAANVTVYPYPVEIAGYEVDKDRSTAADTGAAFVEGEVTFQMYYKPYTPEPTHPDYVTVRYIYTVEGEARDYSYAEDQVPYGSAYTLRTGFKPIDGFVFSGWKTSANLSKLTDDCEVRGSYSPDSKGGKYHVVHCLQNLNGSYSEQTELVTGAVNGAALVADGKNAKNFVGYKFDHAEASGNASIYAEQSGTVKLYYTRNSYTVTYMVDGKQSGKTETYKFGESVTLRSAPDAKKGYTFVGWDADVALGSGSTMPASNVTFSGTMVPGDGVKYTVNIYRENDAGEYELYETSERTGVVGKLTTVKAPKVEGYKAQTFANKTIAADGSTVINVYYDLIDQPYVPVRPNTNTNPADAPVGTMDLLGGQAAQAPAGEDVAPAVDAAEPSVSVENPEVTDIGDEETPLASGTGNSAISIILYIIIGVALVLAATIVYIKNKKLYN